MGPGTSRPDLCVIIVIPHRLDSMSTTGQTGHFHRTNGARPRNGCSPESRSGGVRPNFFVLVEFFVSSLLREGGNKLNCKRCLQRFESPPARDFKPHDSNRKAKSRSNRCGAQRAAKAPRCQRGYAKKGVGHSRFFVVTFWYLFQESPRQTKRKKGPKRKVHEFRPFL